MQKADPLLRMRLHLPFTLPELVHRPRLQEPIAQWQCSPLTLIAAPAGFGRTTLFASCVALCATPTARLRMNKEDSRAGRYLNYLVAALLEADHTIEGESHDS